MAGRHPHVDTPGEKRNWAQRRTPNDSPVQARRLAEARLGSEIRCPGVSAPTPTGRGWLAADLCEMAGGPKIPYDRARVGEPRLADVLRQWPGRNAGRFWNAL